MGWRKVLGAPPQDFSDFSYKSPDKADFSSFCNLNPEECDTEELYFEWMERAAIMEYDGQLSRKEAERRAFIRINLKYKENIHD